MEPTPEQRAWICGRDTGLEHGRRALQGGTVGLDGSIGTARRVPWKWRAAFLNGYGHGIAEAAGAIPGHHFALVVQDSTPVQTRTELVPDRKLAGEEVSPIPLDELAELNRGMGPKELHRLQAMEQLLAEDDLAQGIDPE
jgi:hypothetical protein